MYTRILVPLDSSEVAEQALPYARLLAKGLRIPIELIRIIEPMSPELMDPRHGLDLERLVTGMHAMGQEYLDKIATSLRNHGLSVTCETQEGEPAPQIVAEAQREPGALIAMTTQGRSGGARWVLGSVADKVLRSTTIPLLLVRSQEDLAVAQGGSLTTVVVPLDGSPEAEQILPHVVTLVQGLHPKVVLVRVTPSREEYHRFLEYHYEVEPGPTLTKVYEGPYYEEFSKVANARAMEYLHEKAQEMRGQGLPLVEVHLLHGHQAGSILDLAQGIKGGLVAMTTHGRSGVGRWVLGSVAGRVVRYCESPVLVVRPVNGEAKEA
ncbi:MAG: universal stress protein [Chloroflexi bacterium]|nr:universal stress protein [Chloroflexota bacterium]